MSALSPKTNIRERERHRSEGSKFCQSSDFDGWLANAGGELLKQTANDYLQAWPVSRRVNSSRAPGDDPTLIDRVAA
jgi:hypothetical protein